MSLLDRRAPIPVPQRASSNPMLLEAHKRQDSIDRRIEKVTAHFRALTLVIGVYQDARAEEIDERAR